MRSFAIGRRSSSGRSRNFAMVNEMGGRRRRVDVEGERARERESGQVKGRKVLE